MASVAVTIPVSMVTEVTLGGTGGLRQASDLVL